MDFTTAYARRKAHGDFATAWDAALVARKALVAEAEAEELRAIEAAAQNPAIGDAGSPAGDEPGEKPASPLSSVGGRTAQVRRVSGERWTDAKERRFFDELVASANVRRAAEVAGVSVQAVYARRAKHGPFRMRWAQALENGRAAIETHLVAQARNALDPGSMDLPAGDPRVSIGEAIKIAQMNQARGGRGGAFADPSYEDQAALMHEEEIEALSQRLMRKINGLRARLIRDEGYTDDPETGCCIPPGWVRVADQAKTVSEKRPASKRNG
ncbi:MAG: hypothetical protein ABIO29_07980 [Sphingomicrobium sp.]